MVLLHCNNNIIEDRYNNIKFTEIIIHYLLTFVNIILYQHIFKLKKKPASQLKSTQKTQLGVAVKHVYFTEILIL